MKKSIITNDIFPLQLKVARCKVDFLEKQEFEEYDGVIKTKEVTTMLLNEKISIIRKMNSLTQEEFAEELGVSRQAISKWENGSSIPDVNMLLRVADYYNLTLDQLVRDDFDLPLAANAGAIDEKDIGSNDDFSIDAYLGKICDVSMNSFRYSVIRNVLIVGMYKNMICFIKGNRYGYFNKDKSLGILIKGEKAYSNHNEITCGKCTVYTNKGTYFGGNTYAFSSIEKVSEFDIEVHTGKFIANVSYNELSVILMSDKIE